MIVTVTVETNKKMTVVPEIDTCNNRRPKMFFIFIIDLTKQKKKKNYTNYTVKNSWL